MGGSDGGREGWRGRDGKERRGWGSLTMIIIIPFDWMTCFVSRLPQEQDEDPPRRDPDLLSDRVPQRGPNGKGSESPETHLLRQGLTTL